MSLVRGRVVRAVGHEVLVRAESVAEQQLAFLVPRVAAHDRGIIAAFALVREGLFLRDGSEKSFSTVGGLEGRLTFVILVARFVDGRASGRRWHVLRILPPLLLLRAVDVVIVVRG
eukprot:16437383-Heterocapsa_arctica.AAC.1